MFKKPHYIALGVILLVTLLVLKLPGRTASQIKLAISGLFLPLFGLASSAEKVVEKTGFAVMPRHELAKRITELEQEISELRLRSQQWDAVGRENENLRRQLGWPKPAGWRLRLCQVIGRDPANWWRNIRIDAGLRDGVTTNCPVFNQRGLVGRVAEVSFAQAHVVLLGDPDCRVSVMIEDTRDNGVIAPVSSSPLDPGLVALEYLPRNSQLRAGQRVVTSGLGGIFPKGILIGTLVDHRSVGYGLYNEARVRLAVNVSTLEEVWVKLP